MSKQYNIGLALAGLALPILNLAPAFSPAVYAEGEAIVPNAQNTQFYFPEIDVEGNRLKNVEFRDNGVATGGEFGYSADRVSIFWSRNLEFTDEELLDSLNTHYSQALYLYNGPGNASYMSTRFIDGVPIDVVPPVNGIGQTLTSNTSNEILYVVRLKSDTTGELKVVAGRLDYSDCVNSSAYSSETTCKAELWADGKYHYAPYIGNERAVAAPVVEYVEVPVEVPVPIEVPVEVPVEVFVPVEVPVEIPVEVPVEVEVIRYQDREVPVEVFVEKIREIIIEKSPEEKIVEKVVREVSEKTNTKVVEVPVYVGSESEEKIDTASEQGAGAVSNQEVGVPELGERRSFLNYILPMVAGMLVGSTTMWLILSLFRSKGESE